MAAGIKKASYITRCAEMGICAITLPQEVFNEYIQDNKNTLQAIEQFKVDWQKAKPSNLFDPRLAVR